MSSQSAAALAVLPLSSARVAPKNDTAARTMVVQVRQLVADFEAWRKGFAARAAERKANGIAGHRVFAVLGRPGALVIELDVADPAKATAYLQSAAFRAAMQRAGGLGNPAALVLSAGVDAATY